MYSWLWILVKSTKFANCIHYLVKHLSLKCAESVRVMNMIFPVLELRKKVIYQVWCQNTLLKNHEEKNVNYVIHNNIMWHNTWTWTCRNPYECSWLSVSVILSINPDLNPVIMINKSKHSGRLLHVFGRSHEMKWFKWSGTHKQESLLFVTITSSLASLWDKFCAYWTCAI